MPSPARLLPLAVCALALPLLGQPVPAPPSMLQGFQITQGTIQHLVPSDPAGAFTFAIWIGDVRYVAKCHPYSLRSRSFRLLVDGPTGLLPVTAPPPATCRGSVSGLYGSVVALSRQGPSLRGVIRTRDTTIGIQPLRDVDPSAEPGAHIVYDARNNVPTPGTCVTAAVPGLSSAAPGAAVRNGAGNLKYCEIAIDCDFQFYNANSGNMNNTVLDAEGIMNGTDAIYQADVGVAYTITTVIVRTTSGSNPYSTNSPSGLLGQFRMHWNANHGGIQRDVAHLMTGRNLSGSTIGIAYLGTICGGYGYGLGQRYTNNVTNRIGLTAHELGHNWNAIHCGGSNCWIMCPGIGGCGSNVTAFSPGSISSILAFKGSRLCLSGPPVVLPPQTLVRQPVRIDPNSSNIGVGPDGLSLDVRGRRVVAAWADPRGAPPWFEDIFVAVSENEGLTFLPAARVDVGDPQNGTDSEHPKVTTCASGAIVCVWQEFRAATLQGVSDSRDVGFNRSVNGGLTWNPTIGYLNTQTSGSHVTSDAERIRIASSDDTVYVCWTEDASSALGQSEALYFTRSTDAGQTWAAPVTLNGQVTGHSNGVWPSNDVDDPFMVADGDTVVIAFIDDRHTIGGSNQDDVWVLVSHDRGQTWAETSVETGRSGDVEAVRVAIDGQRMTVVWSDFATGMPLVHSVSSMDGGASWTTESTLSQSAQGTPGASAGEPSVAIVGTRVYVTWADDAAAGGAMGAAGNKAYAAVSVDGGATWTVDIPLDAASPDANNNPQVVATPEAVYVAIEYGVPGNQSLAYAYSRDGVSFEALVGVALSGPDVDFPDRSEAAVFMADPVSGVAALVYRDFMQNGNEPFASAVRIPHLELTGDTIMGQTVSLGVSDVPTSVLPGATFTIALSSTGVSPGVPTNAGLVHLLWDPLTTSSLVDPNLTNLLQGTVTGSGHGAGVSTTWPLPAGSPTIYAVGAVRDANGSLRLLTDPIALVSQ